MTTIAGSMTCALSLAASSFANSSTVLFFTYSVLFGLGTSFVFASSLIVVSNYFQKRRSLALGLVGCGQGLGVMAQGPLLQYLVETTGWRGAFRVISGAIFVFSLVGFSYAPVRDTHSGPVNTEPEIGTSKNETPRPLKGKKKFAVDFSVWKVPAFAFIAISSALEQFGRLTPQIHLASIYSFANISLIVLSFTFQDTELFWIKHRAKWSRSFSLNCQFVRHLKRTE